MSSSPKRWIVLLNKVPRGPLTAEEIRALIQEGHLRHNDIGFQVPETGVDPELKQKAEWKLLWQFPEFDRRLQEKPKEAPQKTTWAGTATPPAASPPEPERRGGSLNDEQAKQKAKEKLPPELLDIAPEDLVVHTTADTGILTDSAPPDGDLPSTPPNRLLILAGAGLALALLAVLPLVLGSGKKPVVPPPPVAVGPKPANPTARPPAAVRRETRVAPALPARPLMPEARVPSSSGRDDDRYHPREDEPDRGEIAPLDEDEEESDDEPIPTPRKKRSGRRVPRAPDHRDDVGSDDPDEPVYDREEPDDE